MSEPASPPKGNVTFLFTDIEDSSRMTNALGNDVYLRDMREPHCERIRKAISDHGGYEVKTIGDSFMVAFDRADDGLACASAIQQALTNAPIEATDREGTLRTVKVRIGVHTAERQLFSDDRGDYGGGDVNFAARVESLGVGGQVLVSDSVHQAAGARERYEWKDWPNRRIKSFDDEPRVIWELLWDGTERGEPGASYLPDWFKGEGNRYIPRPSLEKEVLAAFGKLLPDGSKPRLVTLHGFGGMGKTRLAVVCAVQAVGAFKDGVFFVRLDDRQPTKGSVSEAIGAALGKTGEDALPDRLLADLGNKEMLLLLDNYESVDSDDARSFLIHLLHRTSSVRLLVTGREMVKLDDLEQVISTEEMTNDEAEQLFLARAQLKKGQDWQPTPDEQTHVKRILTLTEGIPLATELAAAWVDKRALQVIADGIENTPLGKMTGEQDRHTRSDQAERHRSLTRCLDWSFKLLEDSAQDSFARLGIFADSFTAETVTAVCDQSEPEETLDRLQDAALISISSTEADGRSRYTMLRPTRAYAAEKLDNLPYAQALRQSFVAYFCQLAVDNDDINNLAKLAVLTAEWRNAIAAAEKAEELNDSDAVNTISEILGDFLLLRGLWSEKERISQCAIKVARKIGDKQSEGAFLNNLGSAYQGQGRCSEAEAAYQQSLTIKREFGDQVGEGITLNNLGIVYKTQGRWSEAEAAYQQSLTITRVFGDRVGEGQTLINLGGVYHHQGRWSEAEAAFQQSLSICREFGDRVGEGKTLNNLGGVYEAQGRWAEAEEAYQQSLTICREFGDRVGEGGSIMGLGNVYQAQGQWSEAEAAHQQSLTIFREIGDRVGEGQTLNNLGGVYPLQGRWAEAEAAFQQSLTIKREFGDRVGEGQTLNNLGVVYGHQDRWQEAEAAFQQSLTIRREFGDRVGEGRTLGNLALLRDAQGDVAGALEWGRESLRVFETTEDEAEKAKARGLIEKWEKETGA